MGIAGALLALVIDRRRELGLLQFLGAASRQIRKLILVEAALLGFSRQSCRRSAWLLSFAHPDFLSSTSNRSVGRFVFTGPSPFFSARLLFVYVATVLAGLYPAAIAVRLDPIEVVHED